MVTYRWLRYFHFSQLFLKKLVICYCPFYTVWFLSLVCCFGINAICSWTLIWTDLIHTMTVFMTYEHISFVSSLILISLLLSVLVDYFTLSVIFYWMKFQLMSSNNLYDWSLILISRSIYVIQSWMLHKLWSVNFLKNLHCRKFFQK